MKILSVFTHPHVVPTPVRPCFLHTSPILTMSLITFRGQQVSIPQEAYGLVCRNDPALRFNQKYLNLCSKDERRSYSVGTTWG